MKNYRELGYFLQVLLLCSMISPATGEELRIGTNADWDAWQRPGNAIEISRGKAAPRFVRRNIDAVANAGDFGGGIRAAGSNGGDAGNLIDGSLSSFWAPDWDDDTENMYVEVDLGRVVSARRVILRLREDGPPLELFQVLLSNGERFFDSAGLPLPSIVRYSDRVRYSFNEQRELVIEYDLKPLQFIRIEVDLPTVGAGISSIAAEAVGDNISLGMRERGGQVEDRWHRTGRCAGKS
ncbi:MAG: discoidin domain-containing protein [Gemmatimonadetes bacterium]|nr:discoidin domain-containing protein [Gemmatimonadota bacterium]MXY80519.1 discoidin domain-containing protein [Gemmatimonadota bacterium]MYB67165.1 discoidin domain-containing protein [Gemmatimonadota bacterium]